MTNRLMVKIGEVWQLRRVLAKELKFRRMTSGLDKLKLRAGTQVLSDRTMTQLGDSLNQKLSYQNWNIRSEQGHSSVCDLNFWTP